MSEFASIMTDKEEPSNISEFTNTVTEKEELSNVEPSNRNESTSIMTDIKESGYTSEFTDMAPTNEKEKSSNRSESTGASSEEMPRDMIIPTTLTTEKEESNITTEHTHTSNDEGRLNDKSLSTNSSTTEKEKLISNVNESANMPIDKEKQSAVGESTSFIIEKEALNGTIKESDGLLPEGRKYDKSEFVCEASFPLLENKDERTENEEFIEIDAEIDDALDEGYMGMECTLERGFSLNESAMQRDFWPDDYEETSPNYVHGNFPNRYSSALKHLIPIRKAPKDKDEMKVDKAGLFSFMSFSWITYLMWKAYKHGLNEDDIPLCSKFEMCQPNTQRLNSYWEEEVKEKGLAKASLHRPVWKFIRTRIIFSLFILICSLIFGFAGPTFFMRYLIGWLSTDEPLTVGIMWAVCLIFCEAMRITLFGIIWALNYRTAIRLRSALLGLVYKKLMNMSHLGNKSIGEVINLFANDGQRVFDFVTLGTFFISGPLVAIAGVIYILLILGPWALLGMTAFLFFYPCQYLISRLSGYLRRKTVTITDQRVRMMNEIFTCIKLIKMYAWEHCFTKSITEIRKRERRYLEKSAYIQSISVAMTPTVPVLAAIITFLAHIGAGYNLTPAQLKCRYGMREVPPSGHWFLRVCRGITTSDRARTMV